MDVRCGRCGTEYEFDDALISERGTTVKCTNCGYQFKVFPDAAALAPERWVVQTATGRELVYTSLRELQRGIAKGYVNANDLLSRGSREARPLASIPELEPFLRQPAGGAAKPAPRTLHGVAPAANSSKGGVGPPSLVDPLESQAAPSDQARAPRQTPALDATLEAVTQPRRATPLSGTVRLADLANAPATGPGGTVSLAAGTSSSKPPISAGAVESTSPPTIPKDLSAMYQTAPSAPSPEAVPSMALASTERTPGVGSEVDRAVSERSAASKRSDAGSDHVSRLEEARALLQHEDQTDSHYVQTPARRNARSRWLVFVVVLAAGGLLAATVGKRYLAQYTKSDTDQPVEADARVTQLLSDGERLMEAGDLERAKEAFSKASALAEGHPKVLLSLAKLEVLRADLVWLKLRLLDPNDKAGIERTHRELGEHVGRAERAVAAAEKAAPEDLLTQRLVVQTKRLHGQLEQARRHVAALSRNASLPENAYALAALDMAEASPVWSSIVQRLRIASANEGGVGRARSALIYALARAGQIDAAKAELEKLAKANPSHPLVFDLREFLSRYAEQSADAGADAAPAAVDPARLGELNTSERSDEAAPAEAGDFRAQLKQAYTAAERGDLAQAERLYRAVLAKHPGNTEALAGLADVANKRNDTDQASRLYAEVLEQNPSYLPALVASADQKWASGDRQGALELYRRILDRAGADSSYGRHAAQRIEQGAAASASKREAAAPSEPSTAPQQPAEAKPPAESEPSDTPPASNDAPHIDTTDLPEFNQ